MLSQPVFMPHTKIKRACPLVVNVRFLFTASSPWDTCAIIEQVCRPNQTPHLFESSAVARQHNFGAKAHSDAICKMTL